MSANTKNAAATASDIISRIERLPYSAWHVKLVAIVGIATFFDSLDVLSIAYVLPAIVPLWHIKPQHVGLLISTGFAGQLVGAIFFGWLSEKIGRLRTLVITVAIYSVLSFLSALSWDYSSLFVFRTLAGLGLGGEMPIAATYINEWCKAKGRGRFFLFSNLIYPVGLLAAALLGAWVVPTIGWRYMFLIGAIPAVLASVLRYLIPESARWLAGKGRLEEADRVLTKVEKIVSKDGKVPLPPITTLSVTPMSGKVRLTELFRGIYLRRTISVWVLWFSCFFVNYGIMTWLPTLLRSNFGLSLQASLTYGLVLQVFALAGSTACAFLVDWTGRRLWFAMSLILGSVPLFCLWYLKTGAAGAFLIYAAVTVLFLGSTNLMLNLYTVEIYPTRMRAFGSSVARAWYTIAAVIGPSIVGFIVGGYGLFPVFLVFGLVLLLGGIISMFFTVETKDRVLEDISP